MDGRLEAPLSEAAARARRVVAVVCAWCRISLGLRPATPVTAGTVSHGLCRDCAQRLATR
ncbi:MAG TPA: hypothetical protein VLC53_19660 [Myxococcota bacterium]|jgi:hypothetical protein|nr:hypothetical protein [Myxococcota bacterium]